MDKFMIQIADALEKDVTELEPGHKFRDYEEWDSLVVLAVIAMIKQNYGITIPRKDFDALVTLEDLHGYIISHIE